MKYSKATKAIQGLSKKYSINDGKPIFELIYKGKAIAWVDKLEHFNFVRATSASKFSNMPYSHKLWMILAELAMTPLDKRKEEHKWNVIVGNDDYVEGSVIAWEKAITGNGYLLRIDYLNTLAYDRAVFTDDEFNALIKHIKKLPDGEWQAKVAEHGKTEVKE